MIYYLCIDDVSKTSIILFFENAKGTLDNQNQPSRSSITAMITNLLSNSVPKTKIKSLIKTFFILDFNSYFCVQYQILLDVLFTE